jgi:hypothetical protein
MQEYSLHAKHFLFCSCFKFVIYFIVLNSWFVLKTVCPQSNWRGRRYVQSSLLRGVPLGPSHEQERMGHVHLPTCPWVCFLGIPLLLYYFGGESKFFFFSLRISKLFHSTTKPIQANQQTS